MYIYSPCVEHSSSHPMLNLNNAIHEMFSNTGAQELGGVVAMHSQIINLCIFNLQNQFCVVVFLFTFFFKG